MVRFGRNGFRHSPVPVFRGLAGGTRLAEDGRLMDEQKTKEALEVLGDLYLTGQTGEAPTRDAPVAIMPPAPAGPGVALRGPTMRLAPQAADEPDSEVAPLPPSDEPGALGTDNDGDEGARPALPAGSLEPEIVLLGNLPVLARPWLSQYARNLAEAHGSIVVAHVLEEDLDLELIAPAGNSLASAADAASETDDEDLTACIQGFSALGPRRPRRCLLHLDLARLEALPAWMAEIGRWTVLTGADEAAVRATVKTLHDLAAAVGDAGHLDVGVAVAGCAREEGESVVERINGLLEEGHGAPTVTLRDTVMRMVPLRQEIVGTFVFDDTRRRDLGHLLGTPFRRPPRRTVTVAEPTPPEAGAVSVPPAPSPPMSDVASSASRPMPAAPAVEAPVPPPPRVADPSTAAAPDLIALGGERLAGAAPMEARCPFDPDVQFALDPSGILHLLIHVAGEDPVPALARLLPLRQWTAQHLPLIRLTERSRAIDGTAEPVAHLFTDQPRIAAELATRCGDVLCVHLLARVGAANGGTWYAAELN